MEIYTILEMTAHDAFPSTGDERERERESSIDLEGNCFRAATRLIIGVEFLLRAIDAV